MDDSATLTPSVSQLSADFAKEKRARSPPLAFEPTPNDALLAPIATSPSPDHHSHIDTLALSPNMSKYNAQSDGAKRLQAIVDKQAKLIDRLHDTFGDERKIWGLERERLHQRIAQLEGLLKTDDGYSPAKSPVLSPTSTSAFTSPQSRPIAKMPSIAEDDGSISLSQRRENAPPSIDLSGSSQTYGRKGSVAFAEETPTAVKVEEIPQPAAGHLSPHPFNNRMEAGHTPMKSPPNSMAMDGMEDTPTRNNTHLNNYFSMQQSQDDDNGDDSLTGPLNLPELPHKPDETNFTLDALSKKLHQIEVHPERGRPMVFNQKSPGLASPVSESAEDSHTSPKTVPKYASHLTLGTTSC